jgi:hypothetical protein
MTAAISSAALVPPEPVFSEPERLALAGFLASYTGLTRDAYMLDLRQFAGNADPIAQAARPISDRTPRFS